MSELLHLPSIEQPTHEQVQHFLARAAFLEEVAAQGGLTAEEAAYERRLTLARIGMGQAEITPPKPAPYKRKYEDREDMW